jgi:hypothetical protein
MGVSLSDAKNSFSTILNFSSIFNSLGEEIRKKSRTISCQVECIGCCCISRLRRSVMGCNYLGQAR